MSGILHVTVSACLLMVCIKWCIFETGMTREAELGDESSVQSGPAVH